MKTLRKMASALSSTTALKAANLCTTFTSTCSVASRDAGLRFRHFDEQRAVASAEENVQE